MRNNIYTILFFSGIMIASASYAQSYKISTVAGNQTAGFSGDGGQATSAELYYPAGVAVDASGNIYVADTYNNRVRMVNTSGVIATFAGNGTGNYSGDGGAATAAELNGPLGVAVDGSGNVYIADQGNNRIRVVSGGTINTYAGTGTAGNLGDGSQATNAQLNNPNAVAVDGSGNLYISDQTNDRVRVVNNSGVISAFAGNGTKGFSGDGGPATAAELWYAYSLAADGSGNVYIGDQNNHRIRKVNASGVISTIAGNGTSGYAGDGGQATAAELNFPAGIAIDAATGNIFFTDQSQHVIRMINTSGVISTVAGNGTAGFSGDGGPATAAELHNPYGLAMASGGNMYVAEYSNSDVRKLLNVTGIDEVTDNGNVTVYPNPNNGKVTLSITNNKINTNKKVEVFNISGQKVYDGTFKGVSAQIDLSNNAKGIYLYRVITTEGKTLSSGRFIIR